MRRRKSSQRVGARTPAREKKRVSFSPVSVAFESGEIFKLFLTFQCNDASHLFVDNISPPTGEYHHQRQLRRNRRVREFVEPNVRVIYVAKLAELFSRSRARIPTRFRAHVADIFLEKYSEEGDERDRVFVGGGMRGRVVHRV